MPRYIKTSFNAGEFSPRLYGRVDLEKYASGCKTVINYVPMPHGGVARRPGFKYIADTKTHTALSRLIPFQFSTEQAYIIEAGDLYMRFYMDGGQIQAADSYTKLLLHMEGINASQSIADSSPSLHTVSAQGQAQIDTDQSKFTGSSTIFDGDGDYLTVPDHADWNYGTGAFTKDFWVRFSTNTGIHCLYYQADTTTKDVVALFYDFSSRRFYFRVWDGQTKLIDKVLGSDTGSSFSADTWYHIALTRGWGGGGNDWALVVGGGNAYTFTASVTMPDHDQVLQLGFGTNDATDFSFSQNAITQNSVTLNSTYSKYGRTSLDFSGSSLAVTDNKTDFSPSYHTNFTADFFIRHTTLTDRRPYIAQRASDQTYWSFYLDGGVLRFKERWNEVTRIEFYGGTISDNSFHHVALVKIGTYWMIFLDGVCTASTTSSWTEDYSQNLTIGYTATPSGTFYGNMNNLRISHGNPLGVNVSTWPTVGNISVPSRYHTADDDTKLLVSGEKTELEGWLDEYRVSKGIARWTTIFTPPTVPYPAGDGSGTTAEIVTTYTEEELSGLRWVQSADVLFIVSPDRIPRKLTRTGHTNWSITDFTFDEDHWPPFLDKNITDTTLDASATTGTGIDVVASAALFQQAHVGAHFAMHSGYLKITSVTDSTNAVATVIKDLTEHTATTDWWESAWSDYRGWPTSITFYEDRLCFGGPEGSPDRIDLSVTRDYENFYRAELDAGTAAADDAMVIYLTSRQINAIRWLAGTRKLVVGTSGGEWWIDGGTGDEPLDATGVARRKMDTEHGSADSNCVLVGSRVIFPQRLARKLREFFYDWQEDQYKTNDLSVLSEHLTNRATIMEMAWQQSPHQILWATLSDGTLLSLTYMREHEVAGWARHEVAGTSAVVESIAVIEGFTEDELWAICRRTIDGSVTRYIERMEPLVVIDTGEGGGDDWELADSFYVDSGITYRGAATSSFSGLDHLEGETVVALADGTVETGLVVTDGVVTISRPSSVVHVGLNFNSDVESLWLINQDQEGLTVGYSQRLTNSILMLYRSLGGKIGPDPSNLIDIEYPAGVGVGADERITRGGDRRIVRGGDTRIVRGAGTFRLEYYTGLTLDMAIKAGFHCYPTVYIRQDEPLPLTVTACITDIE